MDQFYFEEGYIDERYFVYVADAVIPAGPYIVEGYMDPGYWEDYSAQAVLTCEGELVVGQIVEANGSWNSSASLTADASKQVNVPIAMTVETSVSATISHIEGADLFAMSEAAMAAIGVRFRDTESEPSSIFDIATDYLRLRDISSNSASEFTQVVDSQRSRATSMETQAAFSISADANIIKGIVSNLASESQISAVVNVIAESQAQIISEFGLDSQSVILTRRVTVTNLSTAPNNFSVTITDADEKFGEGSAYFGTGTAIGGSLSAVNNQFVILSAGYTWTSSDGQSWTRFANNLTGSRSINTYANGLYLYYNTSTRKIGYSSDLSTWTETTNLANPANDNLFRTAIIFHNSRYYLIYHRVSSSTQRIQRYISSSNNLATATWSFDGEIINTGISEFSLDISLESKGSYAIYAYSNSSIASGIQVGAWGSITRTTVTAAPVTTGRVKSLSGFDYDSSNTWAVRFSESSSGNFISESSRVRYSTDNGTNWTSTTAYGTGQFGGLTYQGGQWIVREGSLGISGPQRTYFGTTPANATEKLSLAALPLFANNRWLFNSAIVPQRYSVSTDTDTWTYYDQTNPIAQQARLIYSRGDDSDLADFGTIDFWFKVNGVNKFGDVFYLTGNTENIRLRYTSGSAGAPNFGSLTFGSERVSALTQSLNTHTNWNHVRISRSGSATSLYYNGSRIYTTTDIVWPSIGKPIVTGTDVYIDEFLISEEVKTDPSLTSFVVPTEPWQNTSDVDLLLHFDTDFNDDAVYIVVVEADLVTESTLSVTSNNTLVGAAELTSESQLSVTAAKNSEINLTAFSDAQLTADIERNRFGDSAQSSEFTQTTEAIKITSAVVELTSEFTQVTGTDRIRDNQVAAITVASKAVIVVRLAGLFADDLVESQLSADISVNRSAVSEISSATAVFTEGDRVRFGTSSLETSSELVTNFDIRKTGESDQSSEFTQVTDSDRIRSTEIVVNAVSTLSAEGNNLGKIESTLFNQANLTADVSKTVDVTETIGSDFALFANTGNSLIRDFDSGFGATTDQFTSAVKIVDVTLEITALGSTLTVAVKQAVGFADLESVSTLEASVEKSVDVSIDITASTTVNADVSRLFDVSADLVTETTQTATAIFVTQAHADLTALAFELTAAVKIAASVSDIEVNSTLSASVGVIKPLASEINSLTEATVAAVKTTDTDTDLALEASVSANTGLLAAASATITSAMTFVAAVREISIEEIVYVIPAEIWIYEITAETRNYTIGSETREYIIR